MVALRKRPQRETIQPVTADESPPSSTSPGASAGVTAVHETAVAPASNNEAASPSDSDALKQRLAELQEAEQRHRERQTQIAAAMKVEREPQRRQPSRCG